ncbi:MAG: hypothetical protein KGD65_13975 [Candidatus Lokiarchaeota archaeon]|nr:hypothetical protein [Candidatus Lokiarchaeota archaeon]
MEGLAISPKIEKQIEKIILKILYEEKSVKSLKILSDKALEKAAIQKITISEKTINLIIHQMNTDDKIEFTQKLGWKIKI